MGMLLDEAPPSRRSVPLIIHGGTAVEQILLQTCMTTACFARAPQVGSLSPGACRPCVASGKLAYDLYTRHR